MPTVEIEREANREKQTEMKTTIVDRFGWIGLGVLFLGTVFNHGCHGEDIDDELSVFMSPERESASAEKVPRALP